MINKKSSSRITIVLFFCVCFQFKQTFKEESVATKINAATQKPLPAIDTNGNTGKKQLLELCTHICNKFQYRQLK